MNLKVVSSIRDRFRTFICLWVWSFFVNQGLAHAQDLLNALSSKEGQEAVQSYLKIYGVEGAASGDGGGSFFAKAIAWIIFGGIGFVAFVYGKKQVSWKALIIGIALMVYPYFFSNTLALYGVGIVLVAVLYFWRE